MDYEDGFVFDGEKFTCSLRENGSVADSDNYIRLLNTDWGQFWVNNHAHVLTGKNHISSEHLYLLLRQINITGFVTGAVQPKLSQKNLKGIPITLPSELLRRAFSRSVDSIFKESSRTRMKLNH